MSYTASFLKRLWQSELGNFHRKESDFRTKFLWEVFLENLHPRNLIPKLAIFKRSHLFRGPSFWVSSRSFSGCKHQCSEADTEIFHKSTRKIAIPAFFPGFHSHLTSLSRVWLDTVPSRSKLAARFPLPRFDFASQVFEDQCWNVAQNSATRNVASVGSSALRTFSISVPAPHTLTRRVFLFRPRKSGQSLRTAYYTLTWICIRRLEKVRNT